jgi:hypothetical protein
MGNDMADDIKDRLKDWTQGTVDAAGRATQKAAEVATDAVTVICDKYQESGVGDKIQDLGSWTKEQLDRSGVTAAAKTVTEQTSDVLDTVSGQKILEHMEERNVRQDKYNDILATKLEEALHRIEVLEKSLPKVPSS